MTTPTPTKEPQTKPELKDREDCKDLKDLSETKKYNYYVLKLEHDCYYVGRTQKTVEERFQEHQSGSSSTWTKLHKPCSIIKHFASDDEWQEDALVLKWMSKIQDGIDKVRGGSYSKSQLSDSQIKDLKTKINGALDNCFLCGQAGHFAKFCPYKNLQVPTSDNSNNWLSYLASFFQSPPPLQAPAKQYTNTRSFHKKPPANQYKSFVKSTQIENLNVFDAVKLVM